MSYQQSETTLHLTQPHQTPPKPFLGKTMPHSTLTIDSPHFYCYERAGLQLAHFLPQTLQHHVWCLTVYISTTTLSNPIGHAGQSQMLAGRIAVLLIGHIVATHNMWRNSPACAYELIVHLYTIAHVIASGYTYSWEYLGQIYVEW